jgi:hypothetical protein
MKYLRLLLVAYAIFYISFGIFLLQQAKDIFSWYIVIYFIINAFILIAGALFERSKYKTKNSSDKNWVKTKERFVDHQSGKLVEVHFHPKTGERKYKEIE